MRLRFILVCWSALLLLGMALAGCSDFFPSTTNNPSTTGFVYVLNQPSSGFGSISAFLADANTGSLTPLLNSPFSVSTGAGMLATSMGGDAFGKFLFVLSKASSGTPPGQVNGFVISQNSTTLGQLTSAGSAVSTAAAPFALAVDPGARSVYVLEGGTVEGFAINNGALSALSGSPFDLGAATGTTVNGSTLIVAASGRFLFVGTNDGHILSVPINSDATLQLTTSGGSSAVVVTAPLSGVANVTSLFADPLVRFLYAVDGTRNLSGYGINSTTGGLTPISATPFTQSGMLGPVHVAVDARGIFVFTANKDSNNVSVFAIAGNGTLTQVLNSPFSVAPGTLPVSLTVDPSANFLYVANNGTNTVSSFVIVSGGLTPSGTPTAVTGTGPVDVVASPL